MIGKKKNKKMGRSKGVENDNPNKSGKKQSKSKKTASSNILKDESVCGDDIFSAPLKKRVEKKEEEKSGEKQWEITLDPEIKTIQQKKATKGKKNKRKSMDEEQMWSKSQEQQLILALSDSKPSDKDFWKKVSVKVGKSTSECISKYQQLYPSPSKKKRKSSTKKKEKGESEKLICRREKKEETELVICRVFPLLPWQSSEKTPIKSSSASGKFQHLSSQGPRHKKLRLTSTVELSHVKFLDKKGEEEEPLLRKRGWSK